MFTENPVLPEAPELDEFAKCVAILEVCASADLTARAALPFLTPGWTVETHSPKQS